MTHCDSRKNFLRLFLSMTVLFLHCSSDSAGPEKPIEPTTVLNFDLKIDNNTVGKIQGIVEFIVHIAGRKVPHKFGLTKDSIVTGTQTKDQCVFEISGKSNDTESANVKWSLTFDKSSNGEVKLSKSALQYKDNVTIDWTNAVQLAKSSNAYKCSSVNMTDDHGNEFVIKDAKIQPFDIKDGKFGDEVLCSQNQPTPGDWTVTQVDVQSSNDYTCIKLKSYIYLLINYTMSNGETAIANVLVPPTAKLIGSTCNYNFQLKQLDQDYQTVQLTFTPGSRPWVLTLTFTNNTVLTGKGNIDVYKAELDFNYDAAVFPNCSRTDNVNRTNSVNMTSGEGALKMFTAASDHSYRCNANETTEVTWDFSIITNSLRVEAFLPNSTTLLTEHVCTLDQNQETSDLIPIIIGAALAALVVIVLVAYLIGRARARGSNYETI